MRERDWLPKGSAHSNAKLTEDDVKLILALNQERLEIRKRLKQVSIEAIANKFDMSPTVIGRIVNGHSWRHV
jgi:hypothetical protein